MGADEAFDKPDEQVLAGMHHYVTGGFMASAYEGANEIAHGVFLVKLDPRALSRKRELEERMRDRGMHEGNRACKVIVWHWEANEGRPERYDIESTNIDTIDLSCLISPELESRGVRVGSIQVTVDAWGNSMLNRIEHYFGPPDGP